MSQMFRHSSEYQEQKCKDMLEKVPMEPNTLPAITIP